MLGRTQMARPPEEPCVVLKCVLAETGDVMRLRLERPLRLERVREVLRQALGPAIVATCEDPLGEHRPLTEELLAELSAASGGRTPAILRLHLYSGPPPGVASAAPAAARPRTTAATQPSESEAPLAAVPKEQRRRRRQQARREQRRARRAGAAGEEEPVALQDAEQPSAEEEEDDTNKTEVLMIQAFEIQDGMELWIESGATKRFLQASGDGRVDFDGELEDATAFVARWPAAGASETVIALQGPAGRFLRCGDGGRLDCSGAGANAAGCRFSFSDVIEGVVLFLGPLGSGHVRAGFGAEAPRAGREAPPQSFRLFTRTPAAAS
mmetsp:Transcript_3123/g.10442  ORF Transcript_3123/g.10442 Transcript_3123/m.10442 type:complete len:325 (+) Transcript_3123:46-1020(+)